MICEKCNDTGWISDYTPCLECELGHQIVEEIEKERYTQEMAELEMREIEEHFRKYPHG